MTNKKVIDYKSGRHFLQVPGPTNVPDRIIQAIAKPTIDHRGPAFSELVLNIIPRLKKIFNTDSPIMIYPSSATGSWESSIVNTLSPKDKIMMFDSGDFALKWKIVAERFGLEIIYVPCNWREGIDPNVIEELLKKDTKQEIKSVMVVHNETSTGVANSMKEIREAINQSRHPALLMVDAVSSAFSIKYLQDEWDVDVTIAGSQKGLMLPPGLSFNVVSEKALNAHKKASLPKSYWNWSDVLPSNETGFYPYTPATTLLFGLKEALIMIEEEGMENIYKRHYHHSQATQKAVKAWGLENHCSIPKKSSHTVTTVKIPENYSANNLRSVILEEFDMSLGTGLGKLIDKVFRIGHLGSFNDLMLLGTLSGVEMGLELANVPHNKGGVQAAMSYLISNKNN